MAYEITITCMHASVGVSLVLLLDKMGVVIDDDCHVLPCVNDWSSLQRMGWTDGRR
jgi:hypothetical protein